VYCEWKETEQGKNTKVNRRKKKSSKGPFGGRRGGDVSAGWERAGTGGEGGANRSTLVCGLLKDNPPGKVGGFACQTQKQKSDG